MKIYVLGDDKETNNYIEMVKNLKCISTKEDLLANGFTNHYKPIIYYSRSIALNDKYPVSFDISLSAKTLKIEEVNIIDENFGQPHFTNAEYNKKIKKIVDNLISRGLFAITQ